MGTETPRTKVRIYITHFAAAFAFLGGAVLVGLCFVSEWMVPIERVELAFNIFQTVLVLSGTIIGYWFGQRSNGSS